MEDGKTGDKEARKRMSGDLGGAARSQEPAAGKGGERKSLPRLQRDVAFTAYVGVDEWRSLDDLPKQTEKVLLGNGKSRHEKRKPTLIENCKK
ncbi:hypothetical protein NDU88_002972 [Pleurodeles waltl]|uniref:Uncharacterized protein n=1 Tax=Pleurodeles waltl TaxID=8319 RepID=A0AAV7VGL7_PLEWA|nr:hypothetical protein NDU88_002972 [Pleurodeles waltl]